MTWTNWSGSVRADAPVRRPTTEPELRELVREAEGTVRVAGAGHSFSPVVPTDDTLLSLERLTGVESVDGHHVTVRAGTPLHQLNRALAARGLALPNMGDIDAQSVAGALATGTHGTGTDHGVLATMVSGARLVTADGGVRELDPSDGDAFRAAQVSLGALGVVSAVTLDVTGAYRLREVKRPMPVDDVLADLDAWREHDHFEFWWFPHTDTALVKTLDRTDEPVDRTPAWEERVENLAWGAMNRAGARLSPLAAPLNRLATATFSRSEQVGPSHEIFPTARDVRFEETEYGVPRDVAGDALRALRREVDWSGYQFPVEFRDVAGDAIPLSPAYGRDSSFLACHAYRGKPYEPLLRECESVLRRFEGRPHWGKRHWLDRWTLPDLYPEWDAFQAVRREFDPDGLFLNDHLRDLFAD